MEFKTLKEKCAWLYDNYDTIHTKEDILDMVKSCINKDSLLLAAHLLNTIIEDDAEYYSYDYSMGTLETPVAIDDEYADYLINELF
jgi:hypothetical protein